MANKSKQTSEAKKPGKTLKEKRVAKHAKAETQALSRKAQDK